jgi:hypothetical protein
VAGWISTAKLPVSIGYSPWQGDGFRYTVGQYGSGDEEWLRRKLLQYPEATTFKIASWANETPELREVQERVKMIVRESKRNLAQ